jgi:hypothetical protein
MMNTENFEVFNRIALHILVRLFEVFPGHIDLDAHRIGIDAKPEDPDETNEEIWENMMLGHDTLTWLRDEGFLAVGQTTMDSQFHRVRLTLKGLTLLGYQPPTLEDGETYRNFAEKGAEVLREGGRGAAVELVKELILRGAGLGAQIFT